MKHFGFIHAYIVAISAIVAAPASGDQRPNVLVIFADDLGFGDLSCFGNTKVATPNIDRLAAGGLRLTHFYSNAPICSSSQVALATGQYPQRWRIHSYLNTRGHNGRRKMVDYLDPLAIHTAQIFKDAGYRTAHFGKWHMGGGRDVDDAPLPTAYGFDETIVALEGVGDRIIFPESSIAKTSEELGHRNIVARVPKRKMTKHYMDHAIDFFRRTKDAPFHLEMFPSDVHGLHHPFAEDTARSSSAAERKFIAVLVELDRQVGRLPGELERQGGAENTIVIFTRDNGPSDGVGYHRKGGVPPGSAGAFLGRKGSLRDLNWKFLVNPDGSGAELYDLSTHIGERNNLAPQLSPQAAAFFAQALAWWRDVGRAYETN